MNTYLIAVYDGETSYIESIKARNLKDAEYKFIQDYTNEDDDIFDDWNDFVNYKKDKGIFLGEFYELSEFYF